MKFLADMGISPRTVNHLKTKGYDAVHLREQGLEKLEDSQRSQKLLKILTIH
jgi:predicted nuclease of predicted toxin-antitoxin system